MSYRVLITGGAGFIGSNLAKEFSGHGADVAIYDVGQPSAENKYTLKSIANRIRFFEGTILDFPSIFSAFMRFKPDRVVHAAALMDPAYSSQYPYFTYRMNVEGTVNVLEASRITSVDRLVNISSVGVYPTKLSDPIDEAHPTLLGNMGHSNGMYGASKAAAEIIAQTYFSEHGLDLVSLRLAEVYGFGMRLPYYIKPMIENSVMGLPTRFETGGDMKRTLTYIGDVIQGVRKALEVDKDRLQDRIFNIAAGRVYTAFELADIIRELLPSADISIGRGLSEIERKLIKYRANFNIGRAKEQLGFEPEYDLRAGAKEYLEIYKSYRKGEE
jgi:UDP-glucose 4-epimerase